jgi:hypothetical protein
MMRDKAGPPGRLALDLPRGHVHRESKKPAHFVDLAHQSRRDIWRAIVAMDHEHVLPCN